MTKTTPEQRAKMEKCADLLGEPAASEMRKLLADLKEAEAERAKLSEYADLYTQARGALDEARETLKQVTLQLVERTAERDAYKKAKAENDERFMLERDAALDKCRQWEEKAKVWLASPEAATRLDGYRELGARASAAENERDALKAELATAYHHLGVIADMAHDAEHRKVTWVMVEDQARYAIKKGGA